jgi:hypothetical protein
MVHIGAVISWIPTQWVIVGAISFIAWSIYILHLTICTFKVLCCSGRGGKK